MRTLTAVLTALLVLPVLVSFAEEAARPLSPKDYSALHILASNPKDPNWEKSIHRLSQLGDGFTVEHLETLDRHMLNAHQAEVLTAALASLRTRVANEDGPAFANSIQTRLERAAWADLSCNPLETKLVPWTLQTIEKRLNRPEIVAELKRIESHYVASVDLKTLFSTMGERVPSYARRILAKAPAARGGSLGGSTNAQIYHVRAGGLHSFVLQHRLDG